MSISNSHRLKSFRRVSDLLVKNSGAKGKLAGNFINLEHIMSDKHAPAIAAEKSIPANWAYPLGALIPSPELPQLHFVMKDNHHTFLLSLENILLSLREAERQGEVPPIADEWWVTLQGKFNVLR